MHVIARLTARLAEALTDPHGQRVPGGVLAKPLPLRLPVPPLSGVSEFEGDGVA